MAITDDLRRQHDAASQMMAGIRGQISQYRGREDAYRLTLGLAQLLGLLRIHLHQADCHLYPDLIKSRDQRTARLARRFAVEMGNVAEHLEHFAMRWSTSAVIDTRFDEFCDDASAMFATLETRIRRENQQLYPLADRLEEPPMRSAA